MAESPVVQSLRAAVGAAPDDVVLRVHLAEVLLGEGRADEALAEAAAALERAPGSALARDQMYRMLARLGQGAAQASAPHPAAREAPGLSAGEPPSSASPAHQVPEASAAPPPNGSNEAFDWSAADNQMRDVVPPMFVSDDSVGEAEPAYDVERSAVRLADVAGMDEVKRRLDAAFFAPMRNPELRKAFAMQLRGGLLLYGPPGCGKTYLARAVAGELAAGFVSLSLAEILDMYVGQSERNLREVFQTARRSAPCVLFLDEIDALGQKRSLTRHSAIRGTVNQLLQELDGVEQANEGLFVIGATNQPWDVDSALRRPGRLDRTLLVLPPDLPAREAILRLHLRDRPVAGIDLGKLAKRTDGYSGADLEHVCETAAEFALLDSANAGTVRMIGMADLERALGDVKPSIGPWLESARNVALFANEGGAYDDLLAYLRQRKLA